MNLVELKAQAYDLLAQIQYLQSELAKVNEQIAAEANKQNAPAED